MPINLLYCDFERLNLIRTQFGSNVRTSFSKNTEAARSKGTGTDGEVAANVPLLVSGGLKTGVNRTVSMTQSQSHIFDPKWSDVIDFIDAFKDEVRSRSDLQDARIGRILIIHGQLKINDLGNVRRLMETKSIKLLFSKGMKQGLKRGNNNDPDMVQIMLDLISQIPHSVQSTISIGAIQFWSTLNENFLLTPSSEIMLKHGTHVQGAWSVLGIVDAVPDNDELASFLSDPGTNVESEGLGTVSNLIFPIARKLLGRNGHQYGITPLVIFQNVE
jgi:hypothetical protein